MIYAPADLSVRVTDRVPVNPSVIVQRQTEWTGGVELASTPPANIENQMKTNTIAELAVQRNHFLQFVRRRVASKATAEDIVQSAYIRASEKASSLRNGESAAAWFYRILRNAVIDHYRHRSVEDRALERWARDLQTETACDAQTEEIVCQCINTVMSQLKPAYNQILREVDIAGKSLDEVARSSGITAGNAAVRVHRARQALKKQLIELCGTCCPQSCGNCTCA